MSIYKYTGMYKLSIVSKEYSIITRLTIFKTSVFATKTLFHDF